MLISVEVNISRDISLTTSLFDEPSNTQKWLKNLRSFELIGGELGMPGAQAKIVMANGLTRIKMIETIVSKDLPEHYIVSYEADSFIAITTNRFTEIDESTTRFVMEQDISFKGSMRMAGLFAGSTIKKQMNRDLNSFKRFVESS